jgi:hypothetical protein
LIEKFDQVIRSSEIRSSDPLSSDLQFNSIFNSKNNLKEPSKCKCRHVLQKFKNNFLS